MAVMFASINIFKPEIHTEELMPALRSPWFVPHVIVYMFAYAVMGIATILALRILWLTRRSAAGSAPAPGSTTPATVDAAASPLSPSLQGDLRLCDTLVRMGWGFITMGIVMGALWAKQAWGDYWTWDPKETWAAATWLSYLLYMHLRQGSALSSVTSAGSEAIARQNSPAIEVASHSNKALHRTLFLLIFSFILLQMCWWGVNYLPSAQGFSLHTY